MKGIAILIAASLAWAGPAAARPPAAAGEIESTRYGRWIVDGEGDWVEASTDNESGSEFGLLCSTDCVIYLDFRIACDEGHDYPAMANSGAGALPITMRCHHYEERQLFFAEATEDYVDMVQQGEEVGFAFPLANGLFRVARFSTKGGYEAMLAAVRIAMKSGKLKQAPKDVSI